MSYFEYCSTVTDSDNVDRLSYGYTPQFPVVSSMLVSTVQENERFRPDKVAYRLYGNPLLSWVVDEANSWYHFSNYEVGTQFYYPSSTALEVMGVTNEYESYEDENF